MTSKILVADDDLEIVELLKFTLEPENYTVLTANDGEEALKRARAEHPDLVILDVNMPKLSGFEVCEKLREDRTTCLIPIIMLTSFSKTKDKITGIKLGADDYMAKPFEPLEVLARVEGLLRRTQESLSANPLTCLPGNVSIENEIKSRLERGESFVVLYTDVDHFKSFNDKYGFERGDKVIKLVAEILRDSVATHGNASDFIGNIGGEDFVAVTSPAKAEPVIKKVIEEFDRAVPGQYDEEARAKGFLWGTDRSGQETKFPLMSISVGVAVVESGKYGHYSQVVERAKDMLKKAKQQQGSSFVIG